jgi:cysteinyl-tRNA synthetase
MKLYDTKAGELRDFKPLVAGQVSMYVCGPTVQSAPHIGHLRSALVYDLMVRWFSHLGLRVQLVRNVTDIDDKILEKALEQSVSWWELAYLNEQLFATDYRRLLIRTPSHEPRATGHIPQMIQLIEKLLELEYAYKSLDGSENIYFNTAKWPNYGELTHQKLDDMEGESSNPVKINPQDFALWKAAKSTEPESASWSSPFGQGRPGWHIECSAMAVHYLGESFDIHGGGLDLRFPHHENELAQSSAAGHSFANYWVHNGLVSVQGQKMSKSLGNSVLSDELFDKVSDKAVRYYLASAHYRSVLDYQPEATTEAAAALSRLHGFVVRAARDLSETRFKQLEAVDLPEEFTAQMNDDLNIPGALAVIHETVTAGNTDLDDQRLSQAHQRWSEVVAMLEVLGLSLETSNQTNQEHRALDLLIQTLIAERNKAREEKNYQRADQIRDQLIEIGIELSDSISGTHWSLN